MADSFKASRKVHSPYLLKKELERIFDKGLLLSSYNIYSQFTPWQMETSILELVALEIAYHAGGLSTYGITKKWTEPVGGTELIWGVDELKRLLAEGKLHNNPMCRKFMLALELQDKVIRIYGTSPGNCHHDDNGVPSVRGGRLTCTCSREGTTEHVLTYFKCQATKTPKKDRWALPL
jgi:hypothetical protein